MAGALCADRCCRERQHHQGEGRQQSLATGATRSVAGRYRCLRCVKGLPARLRYEYLPVLLRFYFLLPLLRGEKAAVNTEAPSVRSW